MRRIQQAYITGVGEYLPSRILSNKDLEAMVDTSDEWIVSRTGISERRIAAEGETTSDMGTEAAKIALKAANLSPEQLDAVIVATMTPDYTSSSVAALVAEKIAPKQNLPAFDVQAACSGFLYALATAKAYVESGIYRTILIVAAEKMSSLVDYEDRATCILFGDGAAAAVIQDKGPGLSIDALTLGSDGCLVDLLYVPAGGAKLKTSATTLAERLHYIKMDGKEVFKHAVRRMGSAAKTCLEQAGLKEEDISWLIPHQANVRIIEALAKGFPLPQEKIYKTVHKYGNTSASSVLIALAELSKEHAIKDGEHLLLVAFGAGFTWGACVLTRHA